MIDWWGIVVELEKVWQWGHKRQFEYGHFNLSRVQVRGHKVDVVGLGKRADFVLYCRN